MMISLIIPAYNEEKTIGTIVKKAKRYVDEVIVVDDGSHDKTYEIALKYGAKVIRHNRNMGYIQALRTGFKASSGDIIVTMDADGQHNPEDIPRLLHPLLRGNADLVLGVRDKLTLSEKIITLLTNFRVKISDASTGFRALKREIALKMKIKGLCTCGTFVLEAMKLGAKVSEVKINVNPRKHGRSRVKKRHIIQILIVLKELL